MSQNRTFSIFRRFAIVVAGFALFYLVIVFIYNKLYASSYHAHAWLDQEVSWFDPRAVDYDGRIDWLTIALATALTLVVCGILFLLFVLGSLLFDFIVGGKKAFEYQDPCRDSQCPCARHIDERSARIASMAAATSAVAAATTVSITSI